MSFLYNSVYLVFAGLPFASQQAAADRVPEFAAHVLVLAQQAFTDHAKLFHDPEGAGVPLVGRRLDAIQIGTGGERRVDYGARRFRGQPVSPQTPGDAVADCADAILGVESEIYAANGGLSVFNRPGRAIRAVL